MHTLKLSSLALVACALSLACQGEMLPPGPGVEPDPHQSPAPGSSRLLPPGLAGEYCNQAIPSPLHRLSSWEMQNTLAAAFPGLELPSARLVSDARPYGYDNDLLSLGIDDAFARSLNTLSIDIGKLAAEQVEQLIDCSARDAACVKRLIAQVAEPLLRREAADLALEEIEALAAGQPFETAVRLSIESLLKAPEFIFRAGTAAGEPQGYAAASRLSYFLWGTPPDKQLLADAKAGRLASASDLRRAAERLLADPRAERQLKHFFALWANLRPDGTNPTADGLAAIEETESFALHVFKSGGSLKDLLLSSDVVEAKPSVAALYQRDPQPMLRTGMLSRAAFLQRTSKVDGVSPVARGVWLLEHVLCRELGTPPEGADATPLPELGANATRREQIVAQTESSAECSGCHRVINPIGFAFDNFGPQGEYREVDQRSGRPIDASGKLPSGESFQDYRELLSIIASSSETSRCLTEQLMRFAFGGGPEVNDRCLVDEIHQGFVKSELKLRELVLEIVSHPRFFKGAN
ncbi:MAG: DUF1588 domain-containing protein [Deltaproteobacteria bacterium]|nr:DUF1588 domain-containing protein [Deltaproteobacteria bacterium]